MRILAVTNMYPKAQAPGLGIFVEQQIQGLRDMGVEVDLVFLDRMQDGIRVYQGVGKKIRLKIEEFKPDLIHIMYGGVMADLITQAVNHLPMVVTFHGSDLLGENLSGFWRALISRYGMYASWRAAGRAKGIVVVSKTLQKALPKSIDQSKVSIIPCGIDLERFKVLDRQLCCTKLGWDSHCFNILFNGNSDDPVKRPHLARDAVKALHLLGINAHLYEMRGVPNQQVPIWLNASDVILLTSLHEGSPTIIKEALACNVPVVSVDVGDVRERIEGIEGCHIALPDAQDLSEKLALVFKCRTKVDGRSKVESLSLENVARELIGFYEKLLKSAEECWLYNRS